MKDLIKEVEFYSVLFNYYYISYLQKSLIYAKILYAKLESVFVDQTGALIVFLFLYFLSYYL